MQSANEFSDWAVEFYQAVGGTLSDSLIEAVEKKEWLTVASSKVSPSLYPSTDQGREEYRRDSLCASLFNKNPFLPIPGNQKYLEEAAKKSWWESEQQCFETNQRLSKFLYPLNADYEDVHMRKFITLVQKKLRELLGRAPKHSKLSAACLGKGTTYLHKGARALIPDKLSALPEYSLNAAPWLESFQDTAWFRNIAGTLFDGRSNKAFIGPQQLNEPSDLQHYSTVCKHREQIVPGDRHAYADKNALTKRNIGIGPTLNVYYQLGVGRAIRRRLNKIGLLLENSQEIHRDLARWGSINGLVATVDVKNASDTVASSPVRLFFPDDWVELMDSLRSPRVVIEKRPVLVEKYSSMGNGYTFELETALFWALSQVCMDLHGDTGGLLSVYGDDIICPTKHVGLIMKVLRWAGFIPNVTKTFTDGPFRESCGGDYWNGVNVRPVHVKSELGNPAELITFLNQLRPLKAEFPKLRELYRRVLSQIPAEARLFGPSTLGDVVIHADNMDRWTTRVCPFKKKELPSGFRQIKIWRPVSSEVSLLRWDPDTALTALLYTRLGEGVTPRDSVTGYRTQWVALDGVAV